MSGFFGSNVYRKFLYALKFSAGVGINLGSVGYGIYTANKNHKWYQALPIAEQEKIYNNCVLQKLHSTNDAVASIQERILQNYDQSLEDSPTLRPFMTNKSAR